MMFAKTNYDYTIIKSPISGLIGNFNLSIGDYVSPSDGNLLSIIQLDPIKVVFSLTDVEYLNMLQQDGKLFKDTVIKLKLANGSSFESVGDFKYSDNQLDKNTNSIAVYAYFNNPFNTLLPNAFVNVETLKEYKNILLINKQLVKIKETGNYINIARNNNILSVPIKIISKKNDIFAIENTLNEGDLLVLDDIANIAKDTKLNFKITN